MTNLNSLSEIFEAWLSSTTEYVYFKDTDGRYIAASLPVAELAGLSSPEDMIGKYDYEIYPIEDAKTYITQDKEVMSKGKTVTEKFKVNHPVLGERWFECVKSPLISPIGEIIGLQGITRDITEIFKLHEKFNEHNTKVQVILDNIPEPVWIKDTTNHYITVNIAYEQFYDITKEEITCHNVSKILSSTKLFSQGDLERLAMQDKEVLAMRETNRIKLWANDRTTKVEIIKSPIISSDNECVGLIGICHDITDRD